MSSLKLGVSDAWADPSQIKVGVSGSWATPTAIYVGSSGSWVQVWPSETVALTDHSVSAVTTTGAPGAYFSLNSDGTASWQRTTTSTTSGTYTGEWLTGGTPSDYECYATVTSGGVTSGTTGAWLNLGTTRSWACTRSTDGTTSATLTVQIRKSGTTTTLASATITLVATRGSV